MKDGYCIVDIVVEVIEGKILGHDDVTSASNIGTFFCIPRPPPPEVQCMIEMNRQI